MTDTLLPRTKLPHPSLTELIAKARADLDGAVRFDHVKAIHDQAEALRSYARSIGAAQTALNAIAEIKLRAERRMGRELSLLEMHPGGRPGKTGDAASPVSRPTLADLGIHKKWSERWQKLARIPAALFEDCLIDFKRAGEELTAAGLFRAVQRLERDLKAGGPTPEPAPQRQLDALERAWAAAEEGARQAFLDRHGLTKSVPPRSDRIIRMVATGT